MISPDYIDRNGIAFWKENSILTKSDKVMQFSGICDVDGVDIFQDDIVEHFGDIMLIVKRHGCFYHKHKTYEAYGSIHSIHYPYRPLENDIYYRILGNIHQHPHLLK